MDQARVVSALALLSKINKAGYKAVICGGYVRDTICDKPIRDIDLYVSASDYEAVAQFLTGERSQLCVQHDAASAEYIHQSIALQEEFDLRDELRSDLPTNRVNLIGLRETEDRYINVQYVTERFNLGICKAGIELRSDRIIIGDEFRRDYKDKQITLYRTDWGHEATMKQFIKLWDKYPWPLRIHKQEGLF